MIGKRLFRRAGFCYVLLALLILMSTPVLASSEATYDGVTVSITNSADRLEATYTLSASLIAEGWKIAATETKVKEKAGINISQSPWVDAISLSDAGLSAGQTVVVKVQASLQKETAGGEIRKLVVYSDTATEYLNGEQWMPSVPASEASPEWSVFDSLRQDGMPDFIWNCETVSGDAAAYGEVVEFRRIFEVPGEVTGATLKIGCDNGYEVSIGEFKERSESLSQDWRGSDLTDSYLNTDLWRQLSTYDLSGVIKQGTNTLFISGVNENAFDQWDSWASPETNPAGLLYKLEINYKGPKVETRTAGGEQSYTVESRSQPAVSSGSGSVKYNVEILIEGEGEVLPQAGTYAYDAGSVLMIKVNPVEGVPFAGWFGANGSEVYVQGDYYAIQVSSNKSIVARFSEPEVVEAFAQEPLPEDAAQIVAEPVAEATEAEVIADEPVASSAELPKTAGIPVVLFYALGGVLTAIGLKGRASSKE